MSKGLTVPEILAILDRLNSRFQYPFEFKCDPFYILEPQDNLWFFHHGIIIMQRFYKVRVTEKRCIK
jgi:hypothetical protein